ncbi:hypothetical protein Taro_041479, partial [Colocasia esculenta]|nr:hypothetical protein [Colocasia esculenta]
MDQQAPVPPVAVPPGDGEAVPVAPVPPRVEVPFVAPVPPPPPVLITEEPVMQVEKFLRLQPPTYSVGLNPDTTEHWVHEIERVFATMRCPAADRVVLAAYQLRGFALECWRLKMQTTFAGRTEEAITWSEFLDVFNDTFFPIQVQQVKREQFRTLQQGNSSVLEYQMRFMALSRYAPYVVSDNNMMVEYFIRGLRVELQDAIVPLMCKTVEEAAQRAATLERSIRTRQVGESGSGSFRLPQQSVGASKGKAPAGPSSSGFGKWGQKLKQAFKGKGRGWGGRQQFQQGRGMEEVCSSSSLSSFSSHSQVKCRLAVVLGGRGVDANLRILQLPTGTEGWLDDRRKHGVAELHEETSYRGAIPVGAHGGFGVNREIVGGLEAEELGVNIVCRQAHQPGCRRPDPLPSISSYKASARSREADSDQVRYQFNGLGRGVPSHPSSTNLALYCTTVKSLCCKSRNWYNLFVR